MKKLLAILSISLLSFLPVAAVNADIGAGITISAGNVETSGTETEKTVSGVTSGTESKTIKEGFIGVSVYAEIRDVMFEGVTLGIDYIPYDIDLGSGNRQDTSATDSNAGVDTGERSASAEATDLTTIYANFPIPGPFYGILGYHDATVKTTESLPTSTYPDADVNGIMYGLGLKSEHTKLELAYSDFDDISLTSTANTNKITADMDAWQLRFSLGF